MTLIVATQNAGKVREFKRILDPLGIIVLSLADIELNVDVEETGSTFAENAKIKAQTIMQLCALPAIADDSGLCVDALGGAPGVYSARYAGEGASDDQRINKLLSELKNVPDEKRTAHFVSSICCSFPSGDEITAEGTCEGKIGYEKRGENGFGYDPVFITEHGSFSEITAEQKDEISHRGKALREFYEKLKEFKENRGNDIVNE
ncbi:XTP/dITP diphosphatase [Hydrogenoanaerobacterium sp.]|uniref:XTP/dITP diphosphatase n=1 Tax=Hydrogenoanaerobacterium sp. TaxID=2953763 RepID=UPI00289B8718|nr:XTP/dITP diphosphatase [Hydrogenoanaerobacterium sp.]